jgi:hypothetical protein
VEAIPEGESVYDGYVSCCHHPTVMLLDSGASHTFINRTFVVKHDIPIGETIENFHIHSLGDVCVLRKWYIWCL